MNHENYIQDANEYPPAEESTIEEVVTESVIEEAIEKPKKNNKNKSGGTNTQIVKVIGKTYRGRVGISVDGYGVRLKAEKNYDVGDEIEIQSSGTIGLSDFKVWVSQ